MFDRVLDTPQLLSLFNYKVHNRFIRGNIEFTMITPEKKHCAAKNINFLNVIDNLLEIF